MLPANVFMQKAMTKHLALNFPVLCGAEGQPSYVCTLVSQLVNLGVISENVSKMLRGPLLIKAPGMTLLVGPSVFTRRD